MASEGKTGYVISCRFCGSSVEAPEPGTPEQVRKAIRELRGCCNAVPLAKDERRGQRG